MLAFGGAPPARPLVMSSRLSGLHARHNLFHSHLHEPMLKAAPQQIPGLASAITPDAILTVPDLTRRSTSTTAATTTAAVSTAITTTLPIAVAVV